ncbi:MAG TPA: FKBP-type peptidyl-prolyl cis-trans isomerase, partial [Candidatus Hydrogenedentes bacterium]|nr:FKBP-type peptidyl-prolyl cis-trans isomerase [Candidatus Hydrogenedentota bacterium]
MNDTNPEINPDSVRHAAMGDTVTVHYRVSTLDGKTVGMSPDDEPLTLVLGEGVFLPGFEAGIEGMSAGEIRDFVIAPEEAFGPVVEEMIQEVGIEAFGPDAHVEVG